MMILNRCNKKYQPEIQIDKNYYIFIEMDKDILDMEIMFIK